MSTNIPSDFTVGHEQESDDQLLSRAKSGNQQAFAELCLRYRGMLLRRIYRIVRHQEDAEDVLQDTLLSTYQHLDTFRGTCRVSTWMMKIAINNALLLLRKRRSLPELIWEQASNDGQRFESPDFRDLGLDPEQRYLTYQTSQLLNRAIERLPPCFRTITDMCYRREYRLKEVAEILGIKEETAKSRMLRARRRLRLSLKNRGSLARRKQ